ncbi:hypothetical protein [Gordonia sihwensis]|uniref:hypothetical protein n=1 Tax=Gordonia sihwensis TaxID=173559 RepID=UPI000A99C5DA|nr:hypothetical protein [Gordonia sihwensis]
MTTTEVVQARRADGTPLDIPPGWLSGTLMRKAGMTKEQLAAIRERNDPTEARRTEVWVGPQESPWYFRPDLAGDAEQIPRRVDGYERRDCLGSAALKERGWTPAHIKRLLGQPDAHGEGRVGHRAAQLWAVERINKAEETDARLQTRLKKFANAAPAKTRTQERAEAEAAWLADATERRLPRWATETRAVIKMAGARWQPERETWLVPSHVLEKAKAVFEEESAARERLLSTYEAISIPGEATLIQAMAERAGAIWVPDRRVWLVPPRKADEVRASIKRFNQAADKRFEDRMSNGPSCHYCGLPATGTAVEFGVPACEECGGE